MIQLVVNADDLGLHPAIDRGILRAHRQGIVTSATVLSRGPCAGEAIAKAKSQRLSLGVHLCLVTRLPPAAPPEQVPSLLAGGLFRSSWSEFGVAWAAGRIAPAEIELELGAQIRLARELGADPDHLDSHQHLHLFPAIRSIVARLSQAEGLPVRWPREIPRLSWLSAPRAAAKAAVLAALGFVQERPERSLLALGVFQSGKFSERGLLRLLQRLPDGAHELMCHPGEDPGIVPEDPTWRYGWTQELSALCSLRVREVVNQRGIQLTTYGKLFSK